MKNSLFIQDFESIRLLKRWRCGVQRLACASVAALTIVAHAQPVIDLSGGQAGRIEFSSFTPKNMWVYARRVMADAPAAVVWGDLYMPKGASGKVPALVYSHGSGGVNRSAKDVWAAYMNAQGVAVFVVDSFKPRGIRDSVQDQSVLNPSANVADALHALKLLATHPQIDANQIFHIGFSRGGGTAFYTAWPMYQRPVDTGGARFAGHIGVYPGPCNVRYRADAGALATAPIFMASADRRLEDWLDSGMCERYAKELAAAGQPVTHKEYAGTYHGFDVGSPLGVAANAGSSKFCDMELQMVVGEGNVLGRDAKDLKTGKALLTYADWNAAFKACNINHRARVGGNAAQTDVLLQDVLKFMGIQAGARGG